MPSYFITKYALSNKGDFMRVDSPKVPDHQGYIALRVGERMFANTFKLGRDVFTDEVAAKIAVRESRDKKIASLEKQIAKLREIT